MKQKSTRFVKYNVMKKFFVLVLFISIGIAQEKLILQQADLLQSSVINEETVTKLSGNIIFKKDDSILKSDFATQYDKSPLVKLNDNVVVTQDSQIIYCDSLIYNKNTEAFSKGIFSLPLYPDLDEKKILKITKIIKKTLKVL